MLDVSATDFIIVLSAETNQATKLSASMMNTANALPQRNE